MINQNKPIQPAQEKRRRPGRQVKPLQAAQALQQVNNLKERYDIPNMKPLAVYKAIEEVEDPNHAHIVELMSHIAARPLRDLTYAIGLKFRDQVAHQKYKQAFQKLTIQQKRELLRVILVDDWAPVIRGVASTALPLIWKQLLNSTYGKKALKLLRDYTGIDLNDDKPGYLGNPFSFDPSLRRGIQWDEMSQEYARDSRHYDGVSVQAVASILFPELTSSRVPSDVAVKSGKVSRTQTYTLTTNTSGAAIWVVYPLRIDSASFIQVFLESTLDTSTGQQTPAAVNIAGPMSGLTSVVSLRTTACSVTVEPIVSSLNNQGRLVSVMSNGDTNALATGAAPTGVTNARDREYVCYSSIAGCSGHRMAYYDSSVADESFSQYGTTRDGDFIEFIVQGAAASQAVLQLTVTYQVEYTINSNVLIELAMPPVGPATMKCFATAVSQNPQLRLLGRQESLEMYAALLCVAPRYDAVLELLVNHRLKHAFESHSVNSYTGQSNFLEDGSGMSFDFQPSVAYE